MAETNGMTNGMQPKSPEKQTMIRLDVYFRRHPSLSSTEFHERWSHEHGVLVKGWLADKGIYRYTQYHTGPETTVEGLGFYDNAKYMDFDGHMEAVVESIDVLKKLVRDDYFAGFVEPDGQALVDMDSVMRTIGYEEVFVEKGKMVED